MKIILLTSTEEADHEIVFEITNPRDLGSLMVALPGLAELDIEYTADEETENLELN